MSVLSQYIGGSSTATANATPNTVVARDGNSTAKFGTPTDVAHPAIKSYTDAAISGVQSNIDSANSSLTTLSSTVSGHTSTLGNATNVATPNTLVLRDGSGRFKAVAPSATDDVVIKSYADNIQTNLTALGVTVSGQGVILGAAASIATPSTLVVRDGSGRFKAVDPAVSTDVATKNYVDTSIAAINVGGLTYNAVTSGASTLAAVASNAYQIHGGNCIATLPTAVSAAGKEILIWSDDSSVITFNTTSGQTISGIASGIITNGGIAYNIYRFVSNNVNWVEE